jgi:hypothetical protein
MISKKTWGSGVSKDCANCKYHQTISFPEQIFGHRSAHQCNRYTFYVHDKVSGKEHQYGLIDCYRERDIGWWPFNKWSKRCGPEGHYFEPYDLH